MSIDAATIDCDEAGFELILTGDFADVFADYLAADPRTEAAATIRLRLPQDSAFQLAAAARETLQPWVDEHDRELAAFRRSTPAERQHVLGQAPCAVLVDELAHVDDLLEAADLSRKAVRERA